MQDALVLYHSHQVHRKEPKSNLKLKAVVVDVLNDQQQTYLTATRNIKAG